MFSKKFTYVLSKISKHFQWFGKSTKSKTLNLFILPFLFLPSLATYVASKVCIPHCLTLSHSPLHTFNSGKFIWKNLWLISVIKEIKRTGFQQSLMFCLHDHFIATDFLTTVRVPSQNKFHICHLKNVQNDNVCLKILTENFNL